MRLTPALAALALGLGLGLAAPAPLAAEVQLVASTPADKASAKAPRVVRLAFSEKVDPARSVAAIVMTAMPGVANHGEMPIRNFTPSWSQDGKTLALTLRQALPAGTYEVRWQAAGADGKLVRGKFGFTVG